jgi:Polysaccharide biosynthesis enzyme WcbI
VVSGLSRYRFYCQRGAADATVAAETGQAADRRCQDAEICRSGLSKVAMPDDIGLDALSRPSPQQPSEEHLSRWQLLGHLESAAIGRRAPDGTIAVRRGEPSGCVLYGPYLHLPEGRYRLSFRCRCEAPRLTAQPVLGVEIIVLSRFQQAWRDFAAAELAAGTATLDFAVSAEHSLEGENEGRFEFRFFHLGNAGFAITEVNLERLPAEPEANLQPCLWRLLGRLQKSWLGRRRGDGSVTVRRSAPAGVVLYGGWPYLRLPRGNFRVLVHADAGPPRRPGRPVLGVEIFGDSRWRSGNALALLTHRPEANGVLQASRDITAEELAAASPAEPIALDFAVPTELALEAGADAPFDIRLVHRGNAGLAIHSVDLVKLGAAPAPSGALAAPRLRPSGRRKIVIIGNCQSETLRQGFVRTEALNKLFDVKYHFVQLPRNLHEFAARDLESCDILLIQDIRLWDAFPLRDCVRPGAETLRFPLVRFASLWPFDTWNGPGDKQAHDREAPNLTFPYLDGLLGRLRNEIPDREARFAAYRALELPEGLPGIVNYRRLHELEIRRLAGIDKQYGIAIGSFILENFQNRRVFHTTVRPNWAVFALLMQFMAKLVGVRAPIALTESIDAALRNPQVPIHPKVARDLGVNWAHDKTRYLNHGREITWETYVRRYIEHYG